MEQEVQFNDEDRRILESYRTVVDGLGQYLGDAYEIILHSLEDLEHSAIAVVHGWHSGRKVGAPITNLALQMLSDIRKDGEHKTLVYSNRSHTGAILKSATIPIKGTEEKIIGLLCMNLYLDTPMQTFLLGFLPAEFVNLSVTSTERFSGDSEDLIRSSVESISSEVFSDEKISAGNRNKEIVRRLNRKGVFQIKDAVNKVAGLLGISRNTVYMHLRNDQPDSGEMTEERGSHLS